MNKYIVGIIALSLSGLASASPFDVTGDNPDLYDGSSYSNDIPTAVQPGVGDSYGGSVYDHSFLQGLKQSPRAMAVDYIGREYLDADNLSTER
ncbi:MAG: hypothetical protein PVG66_11170 [Chromatiales bacterium]|jgi:hypothetical protein